MSGADEYEDALFDIEGAFKSGLRAFAKWCAANWKVGPNDTETLADKSPDWVEGHNNAIDGIDAALDCFLEEHGL